MTESSLTSSTGPRRPLFIETETRTDTITRRRLTSTSNRSVHDILENTKSPTDGLPPTTYTYAHSASYMPVSENGSYAVPVMARRDLHADSHSYSRNTTSLASPTRFISNVRSSLQQGYSTIRDRLTPQRNPLQTPNPSVRPRTPPVHSTPREKSKEERKLVEGATREKPTKTNKGGNIFVRLIKRFFHLPWWLWIPLLFLLTFYAFPHLICKPFEHYPESKIYHQCRVFEEFAVNSTNNLWHFLGKEFSRVSRSIVEVKNFLFDRLDDFVQSTKKTVRRWFGGVKQPVEDVLGTAKEYCDAGLDKVNNLVEEIRREREKFLGPKSALKPEQETQLQQLIQHLLDEYAADETGQADYALEANGAKVVGTRCTEYTDEPRQNVVKFLGIPIVHMSKQPDIMLKAGRLPGQCFPFKGDQGSVIIRLAVPVKPTEFVLEHLSKSISIVGHINSAPKNFTVYALKDKNDEEGRVLGRYFYDAENGPSLQRFKPQLPNVPVVEYVEVRVTSNWGNPNYTCLYRFRVHGDLKTVQVAAPAA